MFVPMCLCLLCFVQEGPDPLLGGWVLPDARISYTGESGSEIVETFPEDRVFHAPLPEGVQAVCTFYLCSLLYIFSFFFTDILVLGTGPYGQCDGGGDQPVEVRVGSSLVCTFLQEPPLYSGNVPFLFFF